MNKLSKLALPLIAATAVAPVASATVAQAAGSEKTISAYLTGYSYYDNTPAGSAEIMHPVIHSTAGGSGTYSDPITLAVGVSGGSWTYSPGTKFYVPLLHKYFIAEDSGGSQLTNPRGGADAWLDLWVGGGSSGKSATNSCMNSFTGTHSVIVNPSSGYAVVSGGVADSGCDLYSDSVSSKSSSSSSSSSDSTTYSAPAATSKATPKATATKTAKATPAPTKEATADAKPVAKATPTATATATYTPKYAVAAKAAAPAAPAATTTAKRAYDVKPGDTLSKIARDNGLSSWQALYELNKTQISNPNLIYVGQHFVLA